MAKLPYKNIYVENRICNLESVCWGPVNLSCRVVLDLRSIAYLLNIKPKCKFKFRFQSKPGIWVSSAHEQRSLSLINDSLATNIDKVSNTNKLLRLQVLYFCGKTSMDSVLPILMYVEVMNNLKINPTSLAAINLQISFSTATYYYMNEYVKICLLFRSSLFEKSLATCRKRLLKATQIVPCKHTEICGK